jgi:hypothetical protein
VDGAAVTLTTTEPYGLLGVPVPAGAHTVEIFFGTTPPRRVGVIISAVGILTLAALVVLRRRGPAGAAETLTTEWPGLGNAAWGVMGVGVAVLAVRAWAGQHATIYARTRFDNVAVAGVQHPLETLFSDQMELLGYDLSRNAAPSGGAVDVTLYWRVLQPLSMDYSTVLMVQDDEGHVYAQADAQNPAGFPTSRWRIDQYGRDVHTLRLMDGTPPGQYHLVANVYRYPELMSLTAGIDLGPVTVVRPPQVGLNLTGGPHSVAEGLVISEVTTIGMANVGEDVPLDIKWSAPLGPVASAQLQIQLVAADGAVAAQMDLPLLGVDFDTTQWAAGDHWLGRRSYRVPAELPSGSYTVMIQALALDGSAPGAPRSLGALQVTAPARTYDAPALAHTESVRFADVAELIGWELADGQLTLAWRALGTADRRYSVFVHVRDVGGTILAQHDAPPQNGARPTTSWLAGEVIVETLALDWPPGALNLAVGLYEPQSGARLRTAHGDDLVVLRP